MVALLSLVTLAVVTILALGAAAAMHWLLLRVALRLMQPASIRPVPARPELVRGTMQLARAYAPRRS
jgi:hypothetical protein